MTRLLYGVLYLLLHGVFFARPSRGCLAWDKRRVIHDRESCRPMSSTSLVSRSTVSQHACPCSCLVSVTCSLSLFLGYRAVQVPRVVLSKNLAPKFCPRDFSASRTARLRDVDWSRLCRIQHGVRAVGFVLSIKIQPPPSDARHRVEESAASPPPRRA